jgi:hypothetical protein
MRSPALAVERERLRRRHLAQAIGEAESVAHAEVVDRQHVRPAELEHQQHLHRPASNASHLRETLDDRIVVERFERGSIGHDAFVRLLRQVAQRGDLREREAGGAQRLLRCRQHCGRRWKLAVTYRVDEAREDRVRRDAVQLLMRDRTRQDLEGLAPDFRLQRVAAARCGDDAAHHGIDARKMGDDSLAHVRLTSGMRDSNRSSAGPA